MRMRSANRRRGRPRHLVIYGFSADIDSCACRETEAAFFIGACRKSFQMSEQPYTFLFANKLAAA